MSKPPIVILPSDPTAATLRTVTGWVSRTGRFYGEGAEAERLARWDGATHLACTGCGATTYKSYTLCDRCRNEAQVTRWEALQLVDYDGKSMFCLYQDDRFFADEEEFFDYCDENELEPGKVMLVACVPRGLRTLDSSYWEDDLAEDGDLPDEVVTAVRHLNEVLAATKEISWYPSDKRIVLTRAP